MIKKILFLLLAVFAVNLFAAETIYAWGYGDMLSRTLMAVKFTFASGDYMGIFKFILLLGLTFSLISMMKLGAMGDMFALPKLFFVSVGVSTLFMVARVDVVVHDLNHNTYETVTDVPWGVAKPMVWFSGMEKHMGEMLETAFAVPSIISYNGGGFMQPFGVINAAQDMRITNPAILQNINTYMYDCVRGDVLNGGMRLGGITETQLMESGDLWALFGNSNPALFTYHYNSTTKSNEYMICPDAYNALNTEINAYVNGDAKDLMAKALGGYSVATLDQILGQSAQYLTGYTGSTSSFLLQSIMIDQFKGSYQSWTTMNGAGTSGGYGFGKAEQTAQANMIISGMLGSKYIPIIKGFLVILIAAMTPIVVLLLLTPMFWPTLIGYLSSMIWLALWHIGEVMLNFIIAFRAESMLSDTISAYGTGGDYTMAIKPVVSSAMMDSMNMASSMYWMIPTIAGFIAGGFAWKSMSGMTGGMTSRVSRGESVSTEVGGATASFGNTTSNVERANMHQTTNAYSYGRSFSYNDSYDSKTGSNNSNTNSFTQRSVGGYQGSFSGVRNEDGSSTITNGTGVKNGQTVQYQNATFDSPSSMSNGTPSTGTVKTTDKDGVMKTTTYVPSTKNNPLGIATQEDNIAGVKQNMTNNNGTSVRNFKGAGGSSVTLTDWKVTAANGQSTVGSTIGKNAVESTIQNDTKQIQKAVEDIQGGSQANQRSSSIIYSTDRIAASNSSQTESEKNASQVAESYAVSKTLKDTTGKGDRHARDKAVTDEYAQQYGVGVGLKGSSSGGFLQGALTTGNSLVYRDTDGKYYERSLAQDEANSYKRDYAQSLVLEKGKQQGLSDGLTHKVSGGGGSTSTDTKTSGENRKVAASISQSILQQHANQLEKSVSVDDGKSATAKVVDDYFQNNYKSYNDPKYGAGLEGMARAYAADDPKMVQGVLDYSKQYTGLTVDPQAVLSKKEVKALDNAEAEVANKTKGVQKKGEHSYNVGQNQGNHANLPDATTAPAVIAGVNAGGDGIPYQPIAPKRVDDFDATIHNTIEKGKNKTETVIEQDLPTTSFAVVPQILNSDRDYVADTSKPISATSNDEPKKPYKREGKIGDIGRRRR